MIPIIITVAYFVFFCIFFSIRSKKNLTDGKQFFTAGGMMGWVAVMCSFCLAPLGGGHTSSLWEQAGGVGVGAAWWGIAFGGTMVPIFMLWFGPMFLKLKVQTFPQGMGKIFGPKMKVWNSAVAPAGWLGIGMAEIFGTAMAVYTLSGAANGPLSVPACVLIAAALNLIYIFFAGMLQASYMNIVNAIVLIVGSFVAIFWLGGTITGGYQGVADRYIAQGLGDRVNLFALTPDVLWGVLIPVIILGIFSVSSEQKQYLPMLSAKNADSIRKGAIPAGIINAMSCFPFVILGVVAGSGLSGVGTDRAITAVPDLVVNYLPPAMVGILMVALLCALLSTGSGVILATSHVIYDDFVKPVMKKVASPSKQKMISRIICVIVCLAAAIPSLFVEIFMNLFFWCFSLSLPIFICYLIGMIWKINRKAAWINCIASLAVNCWWTFALPSWCPPQFSLSFYPVFVVTIGLGVILNLVMPGEKGMLKQIKEQEVLS